MTTTQQTEKAKSDLGRLAALEASNRTFKWITLLALIIALVAAALAAWSILRDRVVAGAFSLAGNDGRIIAELAVPAGKNPGLFLYDEERKIRFWLGLTDQGSPRIELRDSASRTRAAIELDDAHQQQARVTLMDGDGVARTVFGLADNGVPGLEFSDATGQLVYRVPPLAGATPEERWNNFNTQASREYVTGNLPAAEQLYLSALQESRAFGPRDQRRAATLNNLGVLYVRAGKLEQADKAYAEALRIREEVVGKEHQQYAQSLANIAVLRNAEGKTDQADKLFKQSIAIMEKAFGKNDPRLISTLTTYAAFLRNRKLDKAAASLETRIEAIQANTE